MKDIRSAEYWECPDCENTCYAWTIVCRRSRGPKECGHAPPLRREVDGYSINWTPPGGFPEDVIKASGLGTPDPVDHPAHYTHGIETADAIESWGLDFFLGNVVKYVSRHAHKGRPLEDLKKARWYLDRAIKRLEREAAK